MKQDKNILPRENLTLLKCKLDSRVSLINYHCVQAPGILRNNRNLVFLLVLIINMFFVKEDDEKVYSRFCFYVDECSRFHANKYETNIDTLILLTSLENSW